MPNARLLPVVLLISLGFAMAHPAVFLPTAAWAQDSDDDDDDDDDAGGGEGPRGGGDGGTASGADDADRRSAKSPGEESRRQRVMAQAPADFPAFAPGEIVTLALSDADLALLLARGYRVLEARPVPVIGLVSRRLAIPEGKVLEEARAEVRALPTGADADFNHYYRAEDAPAGESCDGGHCAALNQIGWVSPVAATVACSAEITIGVIDTGINPDHDALAKARLDIHRTTPDGMDPSRAIHGTAVVSLLVGDPDSRSPGLLPRSPVIAVDVFHKSGGDERADVFSVTAGMDYLAARDVRVVNMSLAGPPNAVLERATSRLVARGVIIVAAIGNGGPRAAPSYPAAYPGVIGVTAVDSRGKVYRRAGQGDHVDLAAPGVEVWAAASIAGARPKTGTSFAAPFVTATVASLLSAEPELTAGEVATHLAKSALDLGEAGRDPVFGHGVVQAARSCRSEAGE